MKDTRLDNVEIDNEITKHPKKRNSFDDETDAASRPARAYTFPKENDIYTREDSSKMSSFNILANCAAKELKLLTKTREGGGKENQARMPIDSSASDIEDDLNIEFPVIVSGGKKLFKCIYPDCRKAFPSLSRMRRHYIIHTGAKPFKCLNAECPKSFSRRDNMIQHYKGHCIYTKRVSTKLIKNASKQLVEKHYSGLGLDFYQNRDVLEKVSIIKGKKLRNKIAGYATRLMKRIRYGRVKGVSIKAQEEERERNDNFVPAESIIDVENIEVDAVTMEMLKAIGLPEHFMTTSDNN